MRARLILAALAAGLLAALPAIAGEMSADEARRFVIGKMFSYTCFEGTSGSGRITADGSVDGTIQVRGAGQPRFVVLPAVLPVRYAAISCSHEFRASVNRTKQ